MGLFDGLKYGKAASELGLTVEQYKEFLQYQQSDGMTVHAYKTYLKDYAAKMSVRRYIDNVLRAAPKQVHPAKAQAYQVPAYLQKDVPLAVREPEPSFTIKDGVLVGLEVPEGCKKVVIPEGVTEIARDLLMNKADEDNIFQIEILELPSTLKKISSYGLAFLSKLENLVLPEGLEVIESFGLADSFKIKHWVFPSTVKFIGSLVFGEETYAESISILSPNAKVCSNIIYTFCNNVQLNIPRQLSYIEEYMKNMQMHSSQVDSSEYYVTTINYIDVPESGEDSHFDEIEFEIADHVLIGAYIPYGCKDVVIPDGVGRIGYMAMRGCAAERIILPATLCMFDHEVFRECKWLKEIVLPQRVVSMETGVFFGCERLESVQLPLRLESIPADTFTLFAPRGYSVFRGPAFIIDQLKQKLGEGEKTETFPGGIAQVTYSPNVSVMVDDSVLAAYPALRFACFDSDGGDPVVMYSESGDKGVTQMAELAYVKDEGEHWTYEAHVLKPGKYRIFDMRSGYGGIEEYEFPFRDEWEDDTYIIEENGGCYLCSPV